MARSGWASRTWKSCRGGNDECEEAHGEEAGAEVRHEHHGDQEVQGFHGRGTSRHEGARPRAEGGSGGERAAREDRRDAGTGSHHGQAAPCDHQGQRASPLAEDLVRDARVCQGGQRRLLLHCCVQIQLEVRDVRLQRQREPRRRRHVADLVRAEEVDRRRRGKDQQAREEGGELRTELTTSSMATRTGTQSPARHSVDSHDLIRVHGARENNLKDLSVEIPKRRLTVFTGVSGSGKSSLVFDTIAAESQRLINETYSAFVQGFMPNLARPEVDVLEGLTTAIIVDQERMGANPRSTVGTATDANAMLRILFSRLGKPHIGGPNAFSFNTATVSARGSITVERGARTKTERATFTMLGGMCPRCEGKGNVTDIDQNQLYDESKSLAEGALTIPGYTADGWQVRIFTESGFLDPDKPVRRYTKKELHDFLYGEPRKVKINNINLTYEGLIPKVQKSFLSKDVDALQPHIRAFVERAVTFSTCPECKGTRLNETARSSKIKGKNIADACAMQIDELAAWVRGLDDKSVAPLLAALRETLDSFVEIGLGYLSLDRPSGTLSGGEAQRTKMISHLGSSLTDVTYVFDEPTAGLHPHVVHLGPGAGTEGGTVCFEGTVEGLRASGTVTGRHLDDRASLKGTVRTPTGMLEIRGASAHN